jgi:hypothetical protein
MYKYGIRAAVFSEVFALYCCASVFCTSDLSANGVVFVVAGALAAVFNSTQIAVLRTDRAVETESHEDNAATPIPFWEQTLVSHSNSLTKYPKSGIDFEVQFKK